MVTLHDEVDLFIVLFSATDGANPLPTGILLSEIVSLVELFIFILSASLCASDGANPDPNGSLLNWSSFRGGIVTTELVLLVELFIIRSHLIDSANPLPT